MSEISETEIKLMTKEQNYLRGYKDGKCDVLDDIRAEIEETYINLTYEENHKVGGSWGLRKALEIVDKYIAENEVKE